MQWVITNVHFTVLYDLKLCEIINFRCPDSEFEGQKQCEIAKNIVCTGQCAWCCAPKEYQSGWGSSGLCWGMNIKITLELKTRSPWKIDQKNNLAKHNSISPEGEEILLNIEHFGTPTQQYLNLLFVLMKLPWNYGHFCHCQLIFLCMYLTVISSQCSFYYGVDFVLNTFSEAIKYIAMFSLFFCFPFVLAYTEWPDCTVT